MRKRALKVGTGVLGVVCLAAGVATAAAPSWSAGAVFHVDHQLCYAAAGKFKIPVTATGAPGVVLKNQFSPNGFVPLIRPGLGFHCNPVTKIVHTPSGAKAYKVTNPAAHLACLPLTPQKPQPTNKVVVTNQFGSATLVTQQPNLLCLPSWKGLTGPPGKKPTTPPGLSHFACYPVGVANGAYTPPPVALKDEFATKPVAARVTPVPQELCVPTEKLVGRRDYRIVDPATDLLCFYVTTTPFKKKVWDENQFGTSPVYIKATKWLCVPSTSASAQGHLYWVNAGANGTVNEMPIGGGPVTALATGQNNPVSLAVDANDVYWTNYAPTQPFPPGGTVNRVPLGGGSVTAIAGQQNYPGSVAVDSTRVYWGNTGGGTSPGTVNSMPLSVAPPTVLASNQLYPLSVAVDSTHVYWINNGNGTVNKVPIGGGGVTTLASGQNNPYALAVDGTSVYWVNYGDSNAGNGTVNKVPLGGGGVTTLASGGYPVAVAVDGTHVYWVDQGVNPGEGLVREVPLGGGSTTNLATLQDDPVSLAADGTNVYWVNYNPGTVNAVPSGGGSVTTLASGQTGAIAVAIGP
jgi:hypothetical protein